MAQGKTKITCILLSILIIILFYKLKPSSRESFLWSKSENRFSPVLDLSVLNKSVTNILKTSSNVSTSTIQGTQTARIEVDAGGVMKCTSGSGIIQNQTGSMSVVTKVTDESTNQMKNLLLTELDQDMQILQDVTKELGGGSVAGEEEVINESNLKNELKNIIENNVTTENLNDIINSIVFDQDGTIHIKGYYEGPCNIDQTQLIELQATTILSNIQKAMTESEVVTKAITKIKQEQKVELKGLADLVDSVGEAVSSMINAAFGPIIIIGIVVVVFLLGGGTLATSSDTQMVKGPDGALRPVSTGGGGKKKLFGFLFIFIALSIFGYALRSFFSDEKKWPFTDIPEDVEEMGCEDEFMDVKVTMEEEEFNDMKAAEKEVFVTKHTKIIKEYQKCMSEEEETYDNYRPLKEAYRKK